MASRKRGESLAKANGNGSTSSSYSPLDARTDPMRWRMKDVRGVQTWHYLQTEEELKAWPQSTADKWYLGLETVSGGDFE